MNTSRRDFLHSVRAGAAACLLAHPSLPALSRAALFEPVESAHDGLIRLDRNDNAYGPSRKVIDAIHSSIGSVNRYPVSE